MYPVCCDFEKPRASDGQLFIFPRDLIHAWLLDYIPEPCRLFFVSALAEEQTEEKKSGDIYLTSHVIYTKFCLFLLDLRLLSFQDGSALTAALLQFGRGFLESFTGDDS